MSNAGPLPVLHNIAWAPFAGVNNVEIFDRYNGVPTLGTVSVDRDRFLFWRAAFYTQDVSLWVYVPLSEDEAVRLDSDDETDPLAGVIFSSPRQRFATLGVANQLNRLVFEREWCIPAGLTPGESYDEVVRFTLEALDTALSQEPPLPPTRRQVVQDAKRVVRQLLPA